MLDLYIKKLVNYGINTGLIPECERIYSTNLLLEVFGKDDYTDRQAWKCSARSEGWKRKVGK